MTARCRTGSASAASPASPDLAPRPVRQLLRRLGRAVEDGPDLLERDAEGVVQDEREAFCGREPVEHDEQRRPDGVGEDRLVLGVDPLGARDGEVGQLGSPASWAACPACAEHVQGDASDHRREPAAQVVDARGIRAAEPEPRLLHGVVRLACRAEDTERDTPQVLAVLLEPPAQPVVLVHRHLSFARRPSCH